MKTFLKNIFIYYFTSLIALMAFFEVLIVIDKGIDIAMANFHNDLKLEAIVAIIPAFVAYVLSSDGERSYKDAT